MNLENGETERAASPSVDVTSRGGRKFLAWSVGDNYFLYGAASVVAFVAAWYFVAQAGLVSAVALPSPEAVGRAFVTVATEGYAGATLWYNLAVSLARLGVGFGAAVVIGVPLGLGMGVSTTLRQIIDPWIQFYRPVPPIAYLSLVIIWFGVGEGSKFVLLLLAGLAPIVVSTAAAVGAVRRERIEGARSLGVEGFALFRYVILPSCLPYILTSMRVAFGITFMTLIAAEMIATSSGVAQMMLTAAARLETAVVIVGLLVIGVTAILFDRILLAIHTKLTPWAGRA